jgi:glucose-6-phosphate dehydrogenase assembly protein OpcA
METESNIHPVDVTKGVDAARLEKELSAMWAEISEPKEGAPSAGVTRACVLSLIVYTESDEERDEVNDLLEEVMARHPCRAIVLVADRKSAESRLEAYVSTRCGTERAAKQICCEQITIETSGAVVDTASTAVGPMLVPDVPVFLWWKDIPHYEDKLFDRLSEMADRVVIDSAAFDHPHQDMLKLAQILEAGRLRLSDLNWGRLTSWRSLVASFWDVADYRESLAEIERIQIEYDPPDIAHDEIAPKALLALGWIASALKWEIDAAGSSFTVGQSSFKLRGGGRDIEAVLVATDDVAGRDGLITRLVITTARGDEFYVELRLEEGKLETGARTVGAHTVGRVLKYEARTEGQRLSAELDILGRDELYEKSVAVAARLLKTLSV